MRAGLLGMTILLTAAGPPADTIRLKTGAVLVGQVETFDDGVIVLTTRFPHTVTLTLRHDELVPRSLYDILDKRADPGDANVRLQLGELAESNGLYGLAVADYMTVSELRADLREEMLKRIQGVREAIAAELLEDARDLLERGQTHGALMYLHTIRERYGSTLAAKAAQKLMMTGHEHAGSSSDIARKTVSAEKAPKVINSLSRDLQRGDRYARKLTGHEGISSRDGKAADRAIRYFESAWKKIKTLPVAVEDRELNSKIRSLRKSGKERLVTAYLTAGSIHLQRYSIPRAEKYCNMACELEPENKANHELHRLIIEAKINGGHSWNGS